jgi:hypothetical protein
MSGAIGPPAESAEVRQLIVLVQKLLATYLIIPVSLASSGSFDVLRGVVSMRFKNLWLSHFANRPGQLFAGAQNRLTVLLGANNSELPQSYSTHYHRWDAKNGERDAVACQP